MSTITSINTFHTEKTNADVQKTNADIQKTNADVQKTNDNNDVPTVNKKIFRFKLSTEINDALAQFTSLYRYNDRKELKENWSKWCQENTDIILNEERRLLNLGYTGNCVDKMFTSVRYYHIKKANKPVSNTSNESNEINESNKNNDSSSTTKKRKYFTLDKSFLVIIDEHIRVNINNKNFKPAKSFNNFIEIQKDTIKELCDVFVTKGFTEDEFNIKLKKTYKNRYFNIVK